MQALSRGDKAIADGPKSACSPQTESSVGPVAEHCLVVLLYEHHKFTERYDSSATSYR